MHNSGWNMARRKEGSWSSYTWSARLENLTWNLSNWVQSRTPSKTSRYDSAVMYPRVFSGAIMLPREACLSDSYESGRCCFPDQPEHVHRELSRATLNLFSAVWEGQEFLHKVVAVEGPTWTPRASTPFKSPPYQIVAMYWGFQGPCCRGADLWLFGYCADSRNWVQPRRISSPTTTRTCNPGQLMHFKIQVECRDFRGLKKSNFNMSLLRKKCNYVVEVFSDEVPCLEFCVLSN